MPSGEYIGLNCFDPNNAQGVVSGQILLLDEVEADTVGWWVPWRPFHRGSFQETGIDGTDQTGVVKLLASNDKVMPANGFIVTVGGSVAADDLVKITLNCDGLYQGVAIAQYTAELGDTVDDVAAGLAAAMIAELLSQTKSGMVPQEVNQTAAFFQVSVDSDEITIISAQPMQLFDLALTEDGSITLDATEYDSLAGFEIPGATLTDQEGLVSFDQTATWIKATLSSFSPDSPVVPVSVIVQTSVP